MGIYDRDYYRDDQRWNSPFARAKGTVFLCLFYIAVYIAQIMTLDPLQRFQNFDPTGLTEFLELNTAKVLHGEVWRLVTYAFGHFPFQPFHVIVTVIFLAWIGHQIEDLYGIKEYLSYFFMASFLGGVAYTLLALMGRPLPPYIGPSAGMTAIFVLYALHYPTRTIHVFFIIPVPIWIVVGLYVMQDVVGVASGGQNTALVGLHIVGATLALLHYMYTLRVSNLLPGFGRSSPRRVTKPKLRIYREQPQPEPVVTASVGGAASEDNSNVNEHLEAKLDEVLEKMSTHGKESLTDAERDVLQKASAVYKKRRQGN